MKKYAVLTPILAATLLTAACTDQEQATTDSIDNPYVTYTNEDFYTTWQDEAYTTIQLHGTKIDTSGVNAAAIVVEHGTITIKGKGTYVVEGTLTDGQLVVDAAESGTVRVVLNGAAITSSTTAAITVKEADKTVISLEKGTENTLIDASARDEGDEATGALYAKDDLTINGEGALIVNGQAYDGIVGKDNLLVTGGTIHITAADDGILGRDVFAMHNANITIDAQGDGVKSTNDEDENLGNIVLESGTLTIQAGNDGIDAVRDLIVLEGEYAIVTGGGSPETISSDEGFGGMMPNFDGNTDGMPQPPNWASAREQTVDSEAVEQGRMQPPNRQDGGQMLQAPTDQQGNTNEANNQAAQGDGQMQRSNIQNGEQPAQQGNVNNSNNQATGIPNEQPAEQGNGQMQPPTMQGGKQSEQTTADDTTPSTKGLKAENSLQIYGGTLAIDSLDDAVHSNGNVTIYDGSFTINTGDDGIHANQDVTIYDGNILIEKSYEGIEGINITVEDGHIELTASDDGININGGSSDFGQPPMTTNETTVAEGTAETEPGVLTIKGGSLLVDAAGDGLDSNSDIFMTGGTVVVYGPTNSGNGALDYDGTFDIQGGILVAAGSQGMALGVSDTSTQHTAMMTFSSTLEAGTTVAMQNEAGDVVAAVQPTKNFQTLVISTPDLQQDGTYTFTSGGTFTGELIGGFAATGTIDNAVDSVNFTFDSVMTYLDANGVTEKPSGFGDMGGGPRGERPARNDTSNQ